MSTNFPDEPLKGPKDSPKSTTDGGNGQPQRIHQPSSDPSLAEPSTLQAESIAYQEVLTTPLLQAEDILSLDESAALGKLGAGDSRQEISVERLNTRPGVESPAPSCGLLVRHRPALGVGRSSQGKSAIGRKCYRGLCGYS